MSVLVIDDDGDMLDLLGYMLRREGYDMVPARDGAVGLRTWETLDPELILLKLELPSIDGLELCRRIRSSSNTPIIILSTSSDEDTIVRGLDIGADDYVTKPFSPRQLLARVRAVLRRSRENIDGSRKGRETLRAGGLTLDPQFRTVERDGDAVALTPTEFKLLYELVLHEGQVLTNQVLTDRVWGYAEVDDTSIVKGQIYNLRHKIERNPSKPRYIHTIPGSGYTFRQAKVVCEPDRRTTSI
jgi:DNA-binding response OmpR family regulator